MKLSKSIDFQPKLFSALRNYSRATLTSDLMAGLIVGIVALPLAIAFGIASGVSPEKGLITAIVGGLIVSLFGGSSVQIGGPTGAFIVIVYGIIAKFDIEGLAIATFLAGIIMLVMGLLKLGTVIKFIPYPIVVGFTSGIALTIFTTQINDLFGLGISDLPADFVSKWGVYFQNFGQTNLWALGVGVLSILIIAFTPKISKRIPGSLVAIVVMTVAAYLLRRYANVDAIETIGDRFVINASLPKPAPIKFNMATINELLPSAITIALLGSIESLLSATVADGVTGDRHNSNTELIAQGVGNVCSGLFGGIPATGAIARTAANVKNGGRSPVAGMVHAVVLLLFLLVLMPVAKMIPMPIIAAVLFMVAYNMSEWRHFVHICRFSPKSDILVLVVTFILTVVFDLVVAIAVGLVLAAVLFIKRMSDVTYVRRWEDKLEGEGKVRTVPEGTVVYEIHGPMFFADAEKFTDFTPDGDTRAVILRMSNVPSIDATVMRNLEVLATACESHGVTLILSHVNDQPMKVMRKSGFYERVGAENFRPHIDDALAYAGKVCGETEE